LSVNRSSGADALFQLIYFAHSAGKCVQVPAIDVTGVDFLKAEEWAKCDGRIEAPGGFTAHYPVCRGNADPVGELQ
jgi:hypothetical protein